MFFFSLKYLYPLIFHPFFLIIYREIILPFFLFSSRWHHPTSPTSNITGV
ncbi:hypothetical protein E1A91_A05G127500v1 [Gossypium mustelinum]|uniref:Uncharacterized protein n=1 Tax=Gossypium mustelinum TaxID=34275 RepID=A0A5D2Z526_GOSMU|nr:hypothetical protein E1A91_A05G127500v1 [Gossypium mustelinum]